jgi:hypothetical protein
MTLLVHSTVAALCGMAMLLAPHVAAAFALTTHHSAKLEAAGAAAVQLVGAINVLLAGLLCTSVSAPLGTLK